FYDYQRSLTEFNIATKMSECYASGTVPVIIAPEYAAMVTFAKRKGGAVTISDFNDPGQVDVLRNLKSTELRKRILTEARQVALTECSNQVMKGRWTKGWESLGHSVKKP
ncbi:MAG TPA: hypothetical protein VFJ90_09005, partial [Candidatus Didemnitutus sp.]|nr:hypothetical protein [Candidatus Didemnitutus sp.]